MAGSPQEFADRSEGARRLGANPPFGRGPLRGRESAERFSHPLPPELEFLAASGFPRQKLMRALAAAPGDVRPLDAVLSAGVIDEEDYYRALAKHLGCPYYSGSPPFAAAFDVIRGLRCGVAPLEWRGEGPRAVIAPRAGSVSVLMEATRSGRVRTGAFAVASPLRFAGLLRAQRGQAVLEDALDRLPNRLTAKEGMTSWQVAVAATIAAVAAALAFESFDLLCAIASAALWLTFSAAIVLRSMAAVANVPEAPLPLLSDDELPVYTVVAAVYREADVIADLVNALNAFDYPKSKLDIKIVVEQRDLETIRRVAGLRLPACYEVIVAPPGEPRTKPRALNIALSSARGELLVVYDAEDAPSPGQLRLAASRFALDKDIDCLQGRIAIRNHDESWLSKLFSFEYAALFDLMNPGLCALGLPIALGGTSNHFRVRSLVNVGAWDEWNVTEDADLGVRLARYGYRVAALNSDTWEEAPYEFGNWFRQRVRWQKGWMQTLIVHSRHPVSFVRDLGIKRTVAATTLMGGAVLSGLFWPPFAVATAWRALSAWQGVPSASREFVDVYTYMLALSGDLDRPPARDRGGEAARLSHIGEGRRAAAGLLSSGDSGYLDGDVSPRALAASLGKDRPRAHSKACAHCARERVVVISRRRNQSPPG